MKIEIEKYIHLLKEKYALDVSMYDRSFLEKSIQFRINSVEFEIFDDYLHYLGNEPAEPIRLLNHLSNSYSEFFRNPLTFAYLEKHIIPLLIEKKKKGMEKEMRIWSAACASGQEAYSIAILLDELIDSKNEKIIGRIFATDVNPDEILNARKGVFQAAALDKVTLKRIQTYFTSEGETYSIVPCLIDQIDFSVFNLLSEHETSPPASIYGNFDLIFCSNLLFYYQPEYRHRILDKIGNSLSPGGFLVTGDSEREIAKDHNYREVFVNSAIFQKRH
jgi:chemotaxis protein methyltransferase CheR